jgi:hypothetical protein
MPKSKQSQVQCRLTNLAPDVTSGVRQTELCEFELPRCRGCSDESGWAATFNSVEDPMNSVVVSGWLHGELHAPR